MCGILGQVNKVIEIDKEIFRQMLDTLAKRGPDQSGCFFDEKVGLGHRRLSIIDLSEAGRQPMFNENNDVAVVFNGEIYNYQKVKKGLSGDHQWLSKSDTEVLIHGYEESGQKLTEKIEGMFAFAVYDKKRQLITLARDHFGKKPLYYYMDDETFCFASELKAIIQNPQIKKKLSLDESSLLKYLFYGYIPSPNSIFNKVKKLEPATTLQFDIKRWKIINKYCYWNLKDVMPVKNISDVDVLRHTEALLKKAVEKRLMSDVPLGIFLSGGVDSSLIAAYLAQSSPHINSFTVCYKDSPSVDESVYAERVAKKLGINRNLCYFEDKIVADNFKEMLDYLDEPMADAAIIPLYFVSKFAKDKITVVLSGDGGDELFGGYPKYKAQEIIEKYHYLGFMAGLYKNLFNKGGPYYKLLDSFNLDFPVRQFIFGSGSFLESEAVKLLNRNSINLKNIFEEAYFFEKNFRFNDVINKSLYLDSKIQLPDWYLVKGDRAAMATSLEMRNPLLDKELAEFAFSLPGEWKIRKGEQKYILKKLAEKYIPLDIIYRKKSGFGVPLDKWIRKELRPIFEEYIFINNDYFNQEYVKEIYSDHISGRYDNRFKLLRIFNFNYWMKKYYE